jgi:hypothetical protein
MQKTVLAILLGATLAAAGIVWARPEWIVPELSVGRDGAYSYDMNNRGRPDVVEIWRHGHLVMVKQDTRGGGRFDAITYYKDDRPVMFEYDRNYTGVIDYRTSVLPDGSERTEVLQDGAFVEFRPPKSAAAP